jgi:hypothetical protein
MSGAWVGFRRMVDTLHRACMHCVDYVSLHYFSVLSGRVTAPCKIRPCASQLEPNAIVDIACNMITQLYLHTSSLRPFRHRRTTDSGVGYVYIVLLCFGQPVTSRQPTALLPLVSPWQRRPISVLLGLRVACATGCHPKDLGWAYKYWRFVISLGPPGCMREA